MSTITTDSSLYTEAAIFSRVVERSGTISTELAKHILGLGMSEHDQQRVQTLIEKNSQCSLTVEETSELENLNHVADLISLWHSRARQVLKKS